MISRRDLALGSLALAFGGLVWRLGRLQLAEGDRHHDARERQSSSYIDLRPARGLLRSREGELLAASVEAPSVFADPARITDLPAAAAWCAAAFGDTPARWREYLARPRRFVWVQRLAGRVPTPLPAGLGIVPEYRRLYPQGSAAAALLGFADIDGRGREGIERSYDGLLRGHGGRAGVVVDAVRRPVWTDPGLGGARDGADLRLTVSLPAQKALDEAVAATAAEFSPRSISAVAMDPATGAVRALSAWPRFDPNHPGSAGAAARLNRVVTDPFEPGSTIKPLVMARAIESGLVRPTDRFDCPGSARVGSRTIRCHETHGSITAVDVIAGSCNVGAAQIGMALGPRELQGLVARLGFGAPTGIDLPVESRGRVTSPERWNDFTTASVAIGYEIMVTPMQLAASMCALANGGHSVSPHCVEALLDRDGRPVRRPVLPAPVRLFDERAAAEVASMMRQVVERGTGRKAAVAGLPVAGKTGTTQKLDPVTHRYRSDAHLASFVGFVPGLLVLVTVDDPKGAYYGGSVAAPCAGKFLERVGGAVARSVLEGSEVR